MRILTGLLAIALLAAWGPVAPASAQCDPSVCSGAAKAKAAKAKAMKAKAGKMAAKKAKKPAKEMYMRSAS